MYTATAVRSRIFVYRILS